MKKVFKSFLSINPVSITGVLILLILILFLTGIPILELIELKTYDLRFIWRGERKPSQKVIDVVLDEKSLDREGSWPWPRSKFARLVEILSEDGAKVISFDFFWTEPDQKSNIGFISQITEELRKLKIENKGLYEFIENSKKKADNDLIFAESIKKSKAKVILPYFWHESEAELGQPISKEELNDRISRITNSQYPLVRFEQQPLLEDPFNTDLRPYAPEPNIEVLSRVADGSGYINMKPDDDGIVRWMVMTVKFGEEVYTPLSVLTVWNYLDRPKLMVKVADYGIEGIQLGEIFIPTDEGGNLLINFHGRPGIFPQYSITDVFQGKVPKGTFKDKIVLVGSVAVGAHDLRSTPFSPTQPGMDVHASIMENILNNDFISKPKWAIVYDLLAIIIAGILTGFILSRLSPLGGTISVSLLFILHIMLSRWLFSRFGFWVNMVYPLLTIALIYTAFILYHYLIEEKNKRFLQATFSSYLSPELIEEMVSSKIQPELGGEARMVTAYFTDIESFSTFSEILTATQLVELLNEYLTAMTEIIITERGTLDKYEGDAIVAFLGAPVAIPDHALRACRVGVAMQNRLNELRKKWKEEKQLPEQTERNTKNLPPNQWAPGDKWPKIVHGMRMRIGINTGEIVIGNMGSSMRMDYTMMGDQVNLAARLEAGAKQYGIYTCLSEYTLNHEYETESGEKRRVRDDVEVRFIDNITVVGKTEPVKIYELYAMKGDLTNQEIILIKTFDQGLRHYFNMEWEAAMEFFQESLKMERVPNGKTTPSAVFLKRCQQFKETPPVPPGQKWNGVFKLTEK